MKRCISGSRFTQLWGHSCGSASLESIGKISRKGSLGLSITGGSHRPRPHGWCHFLLGLWSFITPAKSLPSSTWIRVYLNNWGL